MNKTLALALSLSTAAACTDDAAAPTTPGMPADMMEQQPGDMAPGATAGSLDATFGKGGMRSLGVAGYASSIARQGDKLVVCANELSSYMQPVIGRFNLDGSVDKTFGSQGLVKLTADATFVCERIEVRGDGSLVAMMRLGADRFAMSFDSSGHNATNGVKNWWFNALTGSGDVTYTAWADNAFGLWSMNVMDTNGTVPAISFSIGGESTANHVFVRDGVFTVTGVYQNAMGHGWGVYRGTTSSADPTPKVVNAGNANVQDLLHDSIILANGNTFLVGGLDTDVAVMTAVFAKGEGTVETHALGATSTARGVMLDGSDRPIVVGSATIDGVSQYMWQRYDASGLALDGEYAGGGVMAAPALSGSGELVAAVRVDSAIYALATNDVEDATPSVGLVKIVE
jgi:hypothetical protein